MNEKSLQYFMSSSSPQYFQAKTHASPLKTHRGGLVASGAYFYDTPTDLRLPDEGRNKKMMSISCRLHMLCAKDRYAFCHNEYVSDDGNSGKIAPHQTMGYLLHGPLLNVKASANLRFAANGLEAGKWHRRLSKRQLCV